MFLCLHVEPIYRYEKDIVQMQIQIPYGFSNALYYMELTLDLLN